MEEGQPASSDQRFANVRSILQGVVLCATAALYILVSSDSKSQMLTPARQTLEQQQLWAAAASSTKGCSSSHNQHHLAECKKIMLTCPRNYYPESGEGDQFGNRPFVCSEATEEVPSPISADMWHVFNVSVCKGADEIRLQVTHVEGLLRAPVNRLYSTGPDFITAQIAGPELRLVPLEYKGDGIYHTTIRAAMPGQYLVDITVAFTSETRGEVNRPPWLTSNLVLLANEAWHASEVSDEEVLLDEEGDDNHHAPQAAATDRLHRLSAKGRWVAIDAFPNATTTAMRPHADAGFFIGYQCQQQYLGKYAWTPRIKEPSWSWSRFKGPEQVMKCLQSIMPAGANHSRLLMVGDSQTRNTFNSLLGMVWPDDSGMRATKDFKSLFESQCFGGPGSGVELCFQWAPVGTDSATLQRYLNEYDRVTLNWGQHLVAGNTSSLAGWLQGFEPQISSLAQTVHEVPGGGALERLVWLQTHLFPQNNRPYVRQTGDRRKAPLLLDMIARTSTILREIQLPEMTVSGLVLPYYDCTVDGAHFGYGLPEQIVREKLLPWICPHHDDQDDDAMHP